MLLKKSSTECDPYFLGEAWALQGKIWDEELFHEENDPSLLISLCVSHFREATERCLSELERIKSIEERDPTRKQKCSGGQTEIEKIYNSLKYIEPNNDGYSIIGSFRNKILGIIVASYVHRLGNILGVALIYIGEKGKGTSGEALVDKYTDAKNALEQFDLDVDGAINICRIGNAGIAALFSAPMVKKFNNSNPEDRYFMTNKRIIMILRDEILTNAHKYGEDFTVEITTTDATVTFSCTNTLKEKTEDELFSEGRGNTIIKDALNYLGGTLDYLGIINENTYQVKFTLPYIYSGHGDTSRKSPKLRLEMPLE